PEPGVPSPDAGSDTLPSVEDEAPGADSSSSYEASEGEGRVYRAAARSTGSYSGKYAASQRLADSGAASASSAYLALAAITAGGLCIAATRRRGYVAKHAA
ncbi:hypothetical protein ACRQG1_09680, partial [Actinotignum sp. GS-2025b]